MPVNQNSQAKLRLVEMIHVPAGQGRNIKNAALGKREYEIAQPVAQADRRFAAPA